MLWSSVPAPAGGMVRLRSQWARTGHTVNAPRIEPRPADTHDGHLHVLHDLDLAVDGSKVLVISPSDARTSMDERWTGR
jgi:hypothetical protein